MPSNRPFTGAVSGRPGQAELPRLARGRGRAPLTCARALQGSGSRCRTSPLGTTEVALRTSASLSSLSALVLRCDEGPAGDPRCGGNESGQVCDVRSDEDRFQVRTLSAGIHGRSARHRDQHSAAQPRQHRRRAPTSCSSPSDKSHGCSTGECESAETPARSSPASVVIGPFQNGRSMAPLIKPCPQGVPQLSPVVPSCPKRRPVKHQVPTLDVIVARSYGRGKVSALLRSSDPELNMRAPEKQALRRPGCCLTYLRQSGVCAVEWVRPARVHGSRMSCRCRIHPSTRVFRLREQVRQHPCG
jgi:hypothetical protein